MVRTLSRTISHVLLSALFFRITKAAGISRLSETISTAQAMTPFNLTRSEYINTTLDEGGLRCFTERDPRVNPTSVEACEWTREGLLSRDIDEHSPLDIQKWAYMPAPEGYHEVPDTWTVMHPKTHTGDFSCRIVVSSGKPTDRDEFRLVDVAIGVTNLMHRCLSPSKGGYGGLMPVGGTKGFFVAIDGYAPPRTVSSARYAASTAYVS